MREAASSCMRRHARANMLHANQRHVVTRGARTAHRRCCSATAPGGWSGCGAPPCCTATTGPLTPQPATCLAALPSSGASRNELLTRWEAAAQWPGAAYVQLGVSLPLGACRKLMEEPRHWRVHEELPPPAAGSLPLPQSSLPAIASAFQPHSPAALDELAASVAGLPLTPAEPCDKVLQWQLSWHRVTKIHLHLGEHQ